MSPRGSEPSSTELAKRRARMVERQLRRRGIEDERVMDAMGAVPRERFVPDDQRERAYRDGALPIGEGQTVSQPWIVARMVELLGLEGPERVLEVGTGSGYAAAVLARCCSHVVTVERRHALAERAGQVLARDRPPQRRGPHRRRLRRACPTGRRSTRSSSPPPRQRAPLRPSWTSSSPGAPLVCPIERGEGERLVRVRDGHEETIVPVRFVPLVEGEA